MRGELTRDLKDYYCEDIRRERERERERTERTDWSARTTTTEDELLEKRRGEGEGKDAPATFEGNADEGDSTIPGNDYDQAGVRALIHRAWPSDSPGVVVGARVSG
jgi:hypothetical protein